MSKEAMKLTQMLDALIQKYSDKLYDGKGAKAANDFELDVAAIRLTLAKQPARVEVCCGDYGKCMRPCTPRGKWLAEQQKQPLTNEEIKEGRTLRWKDDPNEAPEPWSFRMGVEWAEEKHGITKGNT